MPTSNVQGIGSNSTSLVHVIVLDDIDQSPRILNHYVSILQCRKQATLVGFLESEFPQLLLEDKNVRFYQLISFRSFIFPIRILLLFVQLFFYFTLELSQGSTVLVQNPPALPLLPIIWLFKRMKNVCFILDWHNFNYSLPEMIHKSRLSFVRKKLERLLANQADLHYCSTFAMKEAIVKEFGIDFDSIVTCYDKPRRTFGRTIPAVAARLFKRMHKNCHSIRYENYFKTDGGVKLKVSNRPYIAVCASNWTTDESMKMLFDALTIYDKTDAESPIHLFIIGKGPSRKEFIRKFGKLVFRKVKIFSIWVGYSDYQKLLGIADFGISMYRSSSQLDIPMNIIDYFGSGLAIFSIRYKCIHELIIDNQNGFLFDDAEELAFLLTKYLDVSPGRNNKIHTLQQNSAHTIEERWESYWNVQVKKSLFANEQVTSRFNKIQDY